MQTCIICKEKLTIDKFEVSRGTHRKKCFVCRNQEFKKKYTDLKKQTPQKILYEQTKFNECKGICQDCNIYLPHVLDFDHLIPIEKGKTENKKKNNILKENGEFKTIKSISGLSISKLKEELKKEHEWLCKNCHQSKTYKSHIRKTNCIGDIINKELKEIHKQRI